MKNFILKILTFLSLPILILGLVLAVGYMLNINKVEEKFDEISNYECLIMGDSQMQRLKPDFFDCKTYNFASSGEHYYYTYQKIKRIVARDNKLKKVILGVSLPNFGPAYNRLFDADFSEGQKSIKNYLYFIDDLDFFKLKYFTKKEVISTLTKGVFNTPDWGGLFISHKKEPDSLVINKVFNIHYRIKNTENRLSTEQIKYLKKIEQICFDNNIDLYCVTCPIESTYKSKTDSIYYKTLRNTLNSLQSKYINYLNVKIDSKLMSDPVHLNSKGADMYSQMINDSININK